MVSIYLWLLQFGFIFLSYFSGFLNIFCRLCNIKRCESSSWGQKPNFSKNFNTEALYLLVFGTTIFLKRFVWGWNEECPCWSSDYHWPYQVHVIDRKNQGLTYDQCKKIQMKIQLINFFIWQYSFPWPFWKTFRFLLIWRCRIDDSFIVNKLLRFIEIPSICFSWKEEE